MNKKIKINDLKIINPLHEEFVEFLNNKELSDIFPTTLDEFRPLFRGISKFGKLIGYVFNSSWNRKPKLTKPKVRKEVM